MCKIARQDMRIVSRLCSKTTTPAVHTWDLPCDILPGACIVKQHLSADSHQQQNTVRNALLQCRTSCTARARRRLYPSDSEDGGACMLIWVSPTACST